MMFNFCYQRHDGHDIEFCDFSSLNEKSHDCAMVLLGKSNLKDSCEYITIPSSTFIMPWNICELHSTELLLSTSENTEVMFECNGLISHKNFTTGNHRLQNQNHCKISSQSQLLWWPQEKLRRGISSQANAILIPEEKEDKNTEKSVFVLFAMFPWVFYLILLISGLVIVTAIAVITCCCIKSWIVYSKMSEETVPTRKSNKHKQYMKRSLSNKKNEMIPMKNYC